MLLTEWNTADALRVRWQEGLQEGKIQTAVNMLNMGIDINTIAKATDLFVDDVLRLQ